MAGTGCRMASTGYNHSNLQSHLGKIGLELGQGTKIPERALGMSITTRFVRAATKLAPRGQKLNPVLAAQGVADPYKALEKEPFGYRRLRRRLHLYALGAMAGQLSKFSDIETIIATPKELITLAVILAEAGYLTLAAAHFDLAMKRQPGIFDRYRYLGLTHSISELRPNVAREYAADLAAADHLLKGTGTFESLITEHQDSICVVGSSPCEIGKAQGPNIDDHAIVIRFNNFSNHQRFHCDYGRKTDIWVRPRNYTNIWRRPGFLPRLTLCSTPIFWRTVNAQDLAIEYRRSNLVLEETPVAILADLIRELGVAPSAGLIVLSWIHSILGSLKNVGIYGFSMIDQTDGPKHYYTDLKRAAAPTHEWRAERQLLNRLLGDEHTIEASRQGHSCVSGVVI